MQELMLFSGVAPLVREGDKLRSEFTLRNASERDMRVQAQACIRGVDDKPKVVDVRLAPGEAKEVGWDSKCTDGSQSNYL